MHATAFFSLCLFAAGTVNAKAYSKVKDAYTPTKFFSQFEYFSDTDPTDGFVKYVTGSVASQKGYISAPKNNNAPVYIGMDHTNKAPNGRESVRISSKATYDEGLFILDLEHMPTGCGTWPAFWTLGDNWPNNGEIDIIEHVNREAYNNMALHTSSGCSMSKMTTPGKSVSVLQKTCDSPGSNNSNEGCSAHNTDTASYGVGFNNAKGGVYAMEWTDTAIDIWFFTRSKIPTNIASGKPDTSKWGAPTVSFTGTCDIATHFKAHQLIFDTTLCGSWASSVWSSGSCASLADTCNDYVANNPTAFADAYWLVNNLTVYQS